MRTTIGLEANYTVRPIGYQPVDPMSPDATSDARLTMTDRQLSRLLLVASEVGARFQREGIEYDALAWMYAPRQLFRGHAAVEAVTDPDHCERAIIMHALGIGLDADPVLIDSLRSEDDIETRGEFVTAVLESAVN